ncbi:MAG: hypothetical protein IT247_07635 [Bacteroidia bacterium]|nr:hypothetical protein [Bacteroidia bacterium]
MFFFAGMLLRFYRTLSYLNLDVVAGAVICSCFAGKVLQVTEPTAVYNTCLALSIWLVYTIDRLIDISRKERKLLSKRHQFHKTYQRFLWPAVVFVFLLNSWLAVNRLPYTMLVFGLLVVSGVAAYLIAVNMLPSSSSKWFQKEPLIALVYTIGVWGSKLWLVPALSFRAFMVIVVPFFLLALMNLLVFSYFETDTDKENNQRSLSALLGAENVGRVIMVLFALVLTINLTMVRMDATPLYLMISITRTAMGFILFGLFYRSEFFYENERYRIIGDAVFMLPLIPLWLYF